MKKRIRINEIIIVLLIVLYSILFNFFYSTLTGFLLENFNVLSWIFITIISYFIIGYSKNNNIKRKDSIQTIIIYVISYFLLTYLVGIIIGFSKSPYSLNIFSILKNFIPFAIYIICKETTRSILIKGKNRKNIFLFIVIIIYTLFDVTSTIRMYDLTNIMEIFSFIGVAILGNLFKNIMLTYTELEVGQNPGIIYSILMEGYIFFVPFAPNLGIYLETITQIVLPSIIMLNLNSLFMSKEEKKKKKKESTFEKIILVQLIILLIIMISLISGLFKYKIMAIASDSMNPVFFRGDAVIIEKYDKKQALKVGDIIAFEHNGITVVHRIYKVSKRSNRIYLTTKGDNNSVIDDFETLQNDVLGIQRARIPFFGYPTIWLSELF